MGSKNRGARGAGGARGARGAGGAGGAGGAKGLTHVDAKGRIRMVDVGDKPVTDREAGARGSIAMSQGARRLIQSGGSKKGDPIQALQTLGPWLKQCHVKDALRTKTQGTWGQEVVVGTGEVDWAAFFRTLDALHFNGDLCIEREAGNQRVADIRAGRLYLEQLIN